MFKITIITFIFFLSLINSADAAILFEDNFDSSPDWASPIRTIGGSSTGIGFPNTWIEYTGAPKYPPPLNWTSWQASGSEFTDSSAGNFTSTHIVSSAGARGFGKGYVTNVEYTKQSVTGGSIGRYLGDQGYDEIYMQYWAKFDPAWFWPATDDINKQGLSILKLMHIGVTPSAPMTTSKGPDVYGVGGTVPNWVVTISGDTWRKLRNFRSSPRTSSGTDYHAPVYANELMSSIVWPSDGQWHHYVYRVKMNSAPGVEDGITEFWLDGLNDEQHHYIRSNVNFKEDGNPLTRGFNWFTLIGNFRWNYCSSGLCDAPPTNTVVPIYVDDVVVSTTYLGPQYEIGDSDVLAPEKPSGLQIL